MRRRILDRRTLNGPNTIVSQGDEEAGETVEELYRTWHRPTGHAGSVTIVRSRRGNEPDAALEGASHGQIVVETRYLRRESRERPVSEEPDVVDPDPRRSAPRADRADSP